VLVKIAGIAWTGPALDMPLRPAADNAAGQCRRRLYCQPSNFAAHDHAAFGLGRQPRFMGGKTGKPYFAGADPRTDWGCR